MAFADITLRDNGTGAFDIAFAEAQVDVQVNVTGVASIGAVGNVIARLPMSVPVSGVQGAGQLGTAQVTTEANVRVTTNAGIGDSFETVPDTHTLGQGAAQCFVASKSGQLTSAWFKVSQSGSPSSLISARLYTATGTVGSTAIPAVLLATSAEINSNTFPASPDWVEWVFSNPFYVEAGQSYAIALWRDTTPSTVTLQISSSGGHSGNFAYTAPVWTAAAGSDLGFRISQGMAAIQGQGQLGDVATQTEASVEVAGVSATGALGSASIVSDATTQASGVFATGALGDVSVDVSGETFVYATGVQAAGALGTLSATGDATLSVTGTLATGEIGAVLVQPEAKTFASGVQATGKLYGPERISYYDPANFSGSVEVGSTFARTHYGQRFTVQSGKGGQLTKARFYLGKATSGTTGAMYAELYAISFGVPTGAPLATSDTVDASVLPVIPTYAFQEFTFSTPYTVVDGVSYGIVVTKVGEDLYVGYDNTGPSHEGSSLAYITGSGWSDGGTLIDAIFEVLSGNYVTVQTEANILTSGVSASGATGTVTVDIFEPDITVYLTGVQANGELGTANVLSGTFVEVTGVSAQGALGNVEIVAAANALPSGVQAAGETGTVTVEADANALPSGIEATGHVGDAAVSVIGDVLVSVTGVEATGFVGTASAGVSAIVTLTGVESTCAVGDATMRGDVEVLVAAGATLFDSFIGPYNSSHFISTGGDGPCGQAFTGHAGPLTKVRFVIGRAFGGSGTVLAELYATTGSLPNATPTGSALTASSEVDISSIPMGTGTVVEFTFPTPYTMSEGTVYAVVVKIGTFDSLVSVYLKSPTTDEHEGNEVLYVSGSGWTSYSNTDVLFYVYTGSSGLQAIGALGNASATSAAVVPVSGVSATGQLGAVDVHTPSVQVYVTGVQARGEVGQVRVAEAEGGLDSAIIIKPKRAKARAVHRTREAAEDFVGGGIARAAFPQAKVIALAAADDGEVAVAKVVHASFPRARMLLRGVAHGEQELSASALAKVDDVALREFRVLLEAA